MGLIEPDDPHAALIRCVLREASVTDPSCSGGLNDLNVPVQIAQEQLGHASISTTLDLYTYIVDASHRKAIEAVERELFPSVPKPRIRSQRRSRK